MMRLVLLVTAACVWLPVLVLSQERLQKDPTYFIVAPQRIYPREVVSLQVSILKMYYDHINVRASIRMNGEEFTSFFETFHMPSTRLLQMEMPDNAQPGNYTLRVEGSLSGGLGGNIFENETDLIFDVKQVSVFITTNKAVYYQGQEVKFRVIPVRPNLLSVHGSMDLYAVDPSGTVIRRWLSMQTNAGILESSLMLADQVKYGTWTLQVECFGEKYEKQFDVEEFFKPRMYVNVTMPPYIMEDHFAIAVVITANHTSGRPVRGNGTVTLEVRPPLSEVDPTKTFPSINTDIVFFEGRTDMMYRVEDLRNLIGKSSVGEHEVHVKATIFDWFLLQDNYGEASTVVHSRKMTLKLLGDDSRTFKPGFPVSLYYAVAHADGTPLESNRRQVTITKSEMLTSGATLTDQDIRLLVRDDGIVHYQFIPDSDARLINIQAYYDKQQSSGEVRCILSRHYSPTNNYISVSTSTERPVVNSYMLFTVRSSIWVQSVFYMVVAGGNIIVSNVLEMSASQKTFSVALSRDMVPSARIVAYYILDGEVVADSLNFFVNGSTLNEVDVKVNMGKDFSRHTVEVTGVTDPGSYIAFAGLDYDLYAYGASPLLTETEIIRELETYDNHANGSFMHTWKDRDEQERRVYFPAPTYGVDANTTFLYAGLIVYTDANVTRIPHYCNETRGYMPCNDGSCYAAEQRCDKSMQCPDGVDEMGCDYKNPVVRKYTPMSRRMKLITRHYEEDGLWLWKSHFVKPDGRIDLKADVPIEPMTWVIGAFSVSRDKGLGITRVPARYTSTRPFYIRVEMPTDVVFGEQIGVRVALFNYWITDLESLVMLHGSEDYKFVVVEEFGIVSSYRPRLKRGDIQTMVFVEAGNMRTIHLPVLPIVEKAKCINITLSAISFMGRDTITREICVKFDGVTNYFHTPYLIDLINQGSVMLPDLEINVTEQFIRPEVREHHWVPGSQKAIVNVVGDVVGPGFFEPFLNAENYMRKPYGAGENSIFNFGINLYYLKFLKTTNQLRDSVLKTSLYHMNLALQRLLSYYSGESGAFTMFRDYRENKPSVWLTAFSLKTLQNADEADWRMQLYIPTELLNQMSLWLCKYQDLKTGAFWDPSPMYDRKLKSNVTLVNGVETKKNISLTAYVLIALSGAKGVTGAARQCVEGAKGKAKEYLEANLYGITNTFQTALVTYALTVSDSNKRNDAFWKLYALRREGENTYWSDKEIPPNKRTFVNTIPHIEPRRMYPDEGSAVQATAYALLVYLRKNRLREAEPIMQWLQTVRNTIGGFAGTQDTICALEALTEYGKRDTNRDLYNMQILLESTSTPGWRRYVRLNRTNFPDNQMAEVPNVWGSVSASAQGTGLALIQLQTEVNVEHSWLQAPEPVAQFYFPTVEKLHVHGKNFSIMEMTVCARWTRPDLSERTGLTVMEIHLPTGYVVMNDKLRKYVQSGAVPNLGRAEWYSSKIVFYFDYMEANRMSCVNFRADRWYPVANGTIQHLIKVYDYYEPGMFNVTMYTMYWLFNNHICHVCGSFQCPYCGVYYNMASSIHVSVVLAMSLTLFYEVARRWIMAT